MLLAEETVAAVAATANTSIVLSVCTILLLPVMTLVVNKWAESRKQRLEADVKLAHAKLEADSKLAEMKLELDDRMSSLEKANESTQRQLHECKQRDEAKAAQIEKFMAFLERHERRVPGSTDVEL